MFRFLLPPAAEEEEEEGAAVSPSRLRRADAVVGPPRATVGKLEHWTTGSSGEVNLKKTLNPKTYFFVWNFGGRDKEEGGPSDEDRRRGPYPLRPWSARPTGAGEPSLRVAIVEPIAGEGQEGKKRGPAEGLPASVDGRQPSGVGLGLRTVTLGRVQEEEEEG